MLIKKSEIRFDLNYWCECEDVDFCFQHLQKKLHIYCNPLCKIIHQEMSSRGEKQKTNSGWYKKQEAGKKYFLRKWKWNLYFFRIENIRDIIFTAVLNPSESTIPAISGDIIAAVAGITALIYFGYLKLLIPILPFFIVKSTIAGLIKKSTIYISKKYDSLASHNKH